MQECLETHPPLAFCLVDKKETLLPIQVPQPASSWAVDATVNILDWKL